MKPDKATDDDFKDLSLYEAESYKDRSSGISCIRSHTGAIAGSREQSFFLHSMLRINHNHK